jgi:hypothetical protein
MPEDSERRSYEIKAAVLCVEHDQMIRAFASDRPDQASNGQSPKLQAAFGHYPNPVSARTSAFASCGQAVAYALASCAKSIHSGRLKRGRPAHQTWRHSFVFTRVNVRAPVRWHRARVAAGSAVDRPADPIWPSAHRRRLRRRRQRRGLARRSTGRPRRRR